MKPRKAIALVAALAALISVPQDVQARDLTAAEIEDLIKDKACLFGRRTTYSFASGRELAKKNRRMDHYIVTNGRLCVVMWPVGRSCYRMEVRPNGTMLATHRASSAYGGVVSCR